MKWLTKGYAFALRAAMVLKSTVKVKHKVTQIKLF